jgi:hypothetical protein
MNNTALVRIKKEYEFLKNDPPENFVAFPIKVIFFKNRMTYLHGILQFVALMTQNLKMVYTTE